MSSFANTGGDAGVAEKTKVSSKDGTELPKRYKVIFHNDDYTTMEFVVQVLRSVFGHSEVVAIELMLQVHLNGMAVCGVYTAQIAEMKIAEVHRLARDKGWPLRLTMEEE